MTEFEMDRVLSMVDSDNSGQVSFDEFLMTCIDPKEMLIKENLERAFKDFDEDNGGSVSPTEIIKALTPKSGGIPIDTWEKVFNVKPGQLSRKVQEITYNEFKLFMERIFGDEAL